MKTSDKNITPSNAQNDVMKQIVAWYGEADGPQEFYLAGYAGVGKSTVAHIAIEELKDRYGLKNVVTGAFSGKAAYVLRSKGVSNAQTIHSMIYTLVDSKKGEPQFVLAVDGPAAGADLIVLDECSMVGQEIANDLRSFGTKILVMGDPGQLPPVKGHGAFTVRSPDAFLREVHRQAADSPIIHLATLARQGLKIDPGNYGDCVNVMKLTKESQQAVYAPDTQAICGKHTVRWTYTQRIRKKRGFEGVVPCPGERVICCRNDKALGLFNGALGEVKEAKRDRMSDLLEMSVQFDDYEARHDDIAVNPWMLKEHFEGKGQRPRISKGIQEIDWGYVLTCHKSQGSEWPHVTVIDDSRAFRDNANQWLYTAITRASEGLNLLQRT